MGVSGDDGRYQMRSKNRLPKFESAKNPFAQTAKPEPAIVRAQEKVESAPVQQSGLFEVKAEEVTSVKTENETMPTPVLVQNMELKAVPVAPAVPTVQKKDSTQMKDFFKKLNPLPRFAVFMAERRTKGQKPARTHVQTELSLEKVKPVRNDLSDSDLEVVTPKRVVLHKGPQPYLKPLTKPETTTWNRLTTRLFGHTEVR
jgi:hypothetical protein